MQLLITAMLTWMFSLILHTYIAHTRRLYIHIYSRNKEHLLSHNSGTQHVVYTKSYNIKLTYQSQSPKNACKNVSSKVDRYVQYCRIRKVFHHSLQKADTSTMHSCLNTTHVMMHNTQRPQKVVTICSEETILARDLLHETLQHASLHNIRITICN